MQNDELRHITACRGLKMKWWPFKRKSLQLPKDALGLDWNALKTDEAGLEYFDIGDGLRLYPWAWRPIFDVIDTKIKTWPEHIVEENVPHTHPVYGRELYRRYLLPDRANNLFPQDCPRRNADQDRNS